MIKKILEWNGLGHGIVAALAIAAVNLFPILPGYVNLVQILVGILVTTYWYQREKRARGGAPFKDWHKLYGSRDTQWDAVTPAIFSVISVVLF